MISLTLAIFMTFSVLICSLKKYHNYEYLRLRKEMISFMAQLFLVTILACIYEFPSKVELTATLCDLEKNSNNVWSVIEKLLIVILLLNRVFILYFTNLILSRSSKDIFQGISKLDYLLKISFFQITMSH